jgi:hypothetical protein
MQLVYDLEIKNAIPPKDPADRLPDVTYCAGWHDHANMGVAVLVAFDLDSGAYHIYCDDNIEDFFNLAATADRLIGFNNIQFDDKVLEATYPAVYPYIAQVQRYDILREIWLSEGHPPTYKSSAQQGYGLDDMVRINFNLGKSGNGALAPVDWQHGKTGSVIDYCAYDVFLTAKLYRQIQTLHALDNPKHPGRVIPMPLDPTVIQ